MKELSIEEKAKRYDELKVTAQELEHDGCFDKITLFDLFPELKESEDERVRKIIKNTLQSYNRGVVVGSLNAVDYADCIAWLEKQGEQKPAEPKFKPGDKIKYSSNVYDVLAVKEHYYELSNGNVCEFKNQDKWQLVEQKPAWSEEDEKILKDILVDVKFEGYDNDMLANSYKKINWLKSLRPQNTWKPSEEQMADLWNMVCECRPADQQLLQDIYYGLKTLRGE